MSLFTSRHSEYASELEKSLQGVPFSEGLKFDYTGQGNEKDKKTTSPVYLLPVDAHSNVVYGYFAIDGKLAEVPIGFLRKNHFLFKEYFRPALDGTTAKQDRPDEGVLYLPLKLTDLVLTICHVIGDKLVPNDGAPFSILGIEGTQGSYPLILVSETEEGIICKGLYKEKGGQLSSYHHRGVPAAKPIRGFLQELRGVKPTVPRRKVMVESPQLGAGKAAESAKSLEIIANGEIDWEGPKSIVAYLDQYVIGQADAKRVIAVAFSNYMIKVRTQDDELQKDNLLLIGPSGVGKTYMVSLLAKKASLPMLQTKLTGKSTEGYKGENLSTVFEQMRAMTTGEAPYGVIFFDEIDKLARDEWSSGSGFSSRLQDELIGCVEEATVLADRKDERGRYNGLNTRNILFVTAGAFQSTDKDSSLADIIRKRLGKGQKQVGFGMAVQEQKEKEEAKSILPKVRPEDLIAYGLKPELVGRLPSLGVLHPLTLDNKVKILTATKRSLITNYRQLLQLKGYQLEMDPVVPEIIARHCPGETGARALNAVCNDLFAEIMFEPNRFANDGNIIRVTSELAKELIRLYA